MSDEELDRRINDKVDAVLKRMEKGLAERPTSDPPPTKKKHALSGWQAAGIIVAVVTAIATPVMALTWYTADSMSQLEGVQKEVEGLRDELGGLRREMVENSKATNAGIQGLREAFAAYTRVMLPAFIGATMPALPPMTPVP